VDELKPHLSINVTNVAASTEFYEALFGVPPTKMKSDYAKFEVTNPSLNFSLNQAPKVQRGGAFNHAGIQVDSTEAVLAAKTRLTEAGLAAFDDMDTICCYAKQDKIWVRDPDGTAWEIFTTHADVEVRGGTGLVDEAFGCDCGKDGCACAADGAADLCCA
jgi:catechol 2,3-dioxygenase-like lactoylglutathione lyase family enzyme